MARIFKDLLVDEPDGKIRVNLLNRDGTVALHDVSLEVSSPVVQQGDDFGAAAANKLLRLDEENQPQLAIQPQDVGGLAPYTHAKSGSVHTLTGSGDNIRFVATAAFAAGDSIKVGATVCTAKTIAGDALWAGFFASGAVVTCYRTGNTLNFSGAGLSAADKAKLVPGNLLAGVSITTGGVNVAGGIPKKAAATIVPGVSNQTLAAGQYLAGVQTVLGDSDLIPGNIRKGTELFGVVGSLASNLTICASMILVADWAAHDAYHARWGTAHTGDFGYMGNVVYGNGLRCNITGRYYLFVWLKGRCTCSHGTGWQTLGAGGQITLGTSGQGHGEAFLVICKLV